MTHDVDDFLAHYGVKGMRWGIRKSEDLIGRDKAEDAIYEDNVKAIKVLADQIGGKKSNLGLAIGRAIQGREKADQPLVEELKRRSDQNERIKNHESNDQDRIQAASYRVSRPDLILFSDKKATVDPITQEYLDAVNDRKLTPNEMRKNIVESNKKSWGKLDPSDGESRLSAADKKKLVYAGIGVLSVAAVIGASYYLNLKSNTYGGTPQAQAFTKQVFKAKGSWSTGYVKPMSFERDAFELPAGHLFHRLTTGVEHSFNPDGTYATTNLDDFNRYLTSFRHEKGSSANFGHVTFRAKEPIKVPNLTTTLETFREVLEESTGKSHSTKSVISEYETISGSSWGSKNAVALVNALKKKGYGAIVDEMDAGVIGDLPLVVFADDKLTKKEQVPLTQKDFELAESAVKLLTRSK